MFFTSIYIPLQDPLHGKLPSGCVVLLLVVLHCSSTCTERIVGPLHDLLAPLHDFLPNDQALVKLLKVVPCWSERSDIGCTELSSGSEVVLWIGIDFWTHFCVFKV